MDTINNTNQHNADENVQQPDIATLSDTESVGSQEEFPLYPGFATDGQSCFNLTTQRFVETRNRICRERGLLEINDLQMDRQFKDQLLGMETLCEMHNEYLAAQGRTMMRNPIAFQSGGLLPGNGVAPDPETTAPSVPTATLTQADLAALNYIRNRAVTAVPIDPIEQRNFIRSVANDAYQAMAAAQTDIQPPSQDRIEELIRSNNIYSARRTLISSHGLRERSRGITAQGWRYWDGAEYARWIVESFWGGLISFLYRWWFWYDEDHHIYLPETLELPDINPTTVCTGARDGSKPPYEDHRYCIHRDGSPCTMWNETFVPPSHAIMDWANIYQSLQRAHSIEHVRNMYRLFVIKYNATPRKADKQASWFYIRNIVEELASYGLSDDQLWTLSSAHQHAKHNYHMMIIRCVSCVILAPFSFFFPIIGISCGGYLLTDFIYHTYLRHVTKKYRKITAQIHEKAMKVIMGTALVVAVISIVGYIAKRYVATKPKKKRDESLEDTCDQAHYMTISNFTQLITATGDLLMHFIREFGIAIPEEIGTAVLKTLTSVKLTNSVVRAFYTYMNSSYDQATMDEVPPMFRAIFHNSVESGTVNVDSVRNWLTHQSETDPEFNQKLEFQIKYWSWLQDKPGNAQEAYFRRWMESERDFNLAYFEKEYVLTLRFDAYKDLTNRVSTVEQMEEGPEEEEDSTQPSQEVETLWLRTREFWTNKKVPKFAVQMIIGFMTILLVGGSYYVYRKRSKQAAKEEALEEGKGTLAAQRTGSVKLANQMAQLRQDNNNNNYQPRPRQAKVGPLTNAARELGDTRYLNRLTPATRSLGTKKPSELAGYEYVFLRVGNRQIKWDVHRDQYAQVPELSKLFKLAKQQNEKVYVLLPSRDPDTGASHVYPQLGYELIPEALTISERERQKYDQSIGAYSESWEELSLIDRQDYLTKFEKLGIPKEIFAGLRWNHQEISDAVIHYARNFIAKEEAKNGEEALVGGIMYDLAKMGNSIFEIRFPGGRIGHGFVADSLCWTNKHVLTTLDERKDCDIPKDRKYTIRTLSGQELDTTFDIVYDGKLNDFVAFRIKGLNLPSLTMSHSVVNNTAYTGMGLIYCSSLNESLKLRVSVGTVYCNASVITHSIPTVAGVSGSPIFDSEGRVLGIHKGTLQITNQGIPLRYAMDIMNTARNTKAPQTAEEFVNWCDQSKIDRTSHKWRPRVPYRLVKVPWNPTRTYEEDGQEKTFTVAPLKKYDYLGQIEGIKYKQEVLFKVDPVAKFMEEEGLRMSKGMYRPIHPTLESEYRDIEKRDNCLPIKPNIEALECAMEICIQMWDDVQQTGDFFDNRAHKLAGTLGLDDVIQYHFDEEGNMLDVTSPLMDLRKQPGFSENMQFWSAKEVLMKCRNQFIERQHALFEEEMPDPSDPDRLVYIYQVKRKNEFRDILRVLQGKGRAFYPENIDFKVLGKRLWHLMEQTDLEAPFWLKYSWYGETIFYGNWHALITWLDEFPFELDIDIKCMDGCFRERWHNFIRDWRKTHKHPEDHIAVDNYYRHVTRTPIVMSDGAVLVKKDGEGDQKSGQELTLDDNCKANQLVTVYSITRHMHEECKFTYADIKTFWKHYFKFVTMGDDLILRTLLKSYTRQIAQQYIREMGFDCDDGPDFDKKYDTPFCGFRTKEVNGFFLPVLDPARICDATQFNKNIAPAEVIGKLESLFMLSAPEPYLAAQMFLFTQRYVEHVLYDPHFQGICNEEQRRLAKERWINFMDYHTAINMYFPEEEGYRRCMSDNPEFSWLAANHWIEWEYDEAMRRMFAFNGGSPHELMVEDEFEFVIDFHDRRLRAVDKLCEEYISLFSEQCAHDQTTIEMKYGNYCGPNWSDGKQQPSVEKGTTQPVDGFDAACQKHDSAYATATSKRDLADADDRFVQDASQQGIFGTIAARAARTYNRYTDYKDYPLKPRREEPKHTKLALPASASGSCETAKPVTTTQKGKIENANSFSAMNNNNKTMAKDMFKNAGKRKRQHPKPKPKPRGRRGPRQRGPRPRRPRGRNNGNNVVGLTQNFRRRVRAPRVKTNKNTMRSAGEILLANLNIPNAVSIGDVLLTFNLAPQALIGTELQIYAKMYEKYRFRKIKIHYRQSCATNTTGQVVSFIDPDLRDTYAAGVQGIRAAQSIDGNVTHALYTPAVTNWHDKGKYQSYWTEDINTEDLLCVQGKFVVQANFESTNQSFQAGAYYLDYVIDFFDKHNQWSNLTSTSYMSWNQTSNNNVQQPVHSPYNSYDMVMAGNLWTVRGLAPGDRFVAMVMYNLNTPTVQPAITTGGFTVEYTRQAFADQSLIFWQGLVTSTNGNITFQQTTNPTFTGVGNASPRFIFFPFPGSLATMTASLPQKTKAKYGFIDQIIGEKLAQLNLDADKKVPADISDLTKSELDETFQALSIEKSERERERGFSPTRLPGYLLSRKN